MHLRNLNGKKIAIWGLGKEGRSSIKFLRAHFPDQPVTLIDDHRLTDEQIAEYQSYQPVEFLFNDGDPVSLTTFDIVIKSPGISRYRPDIIDAKARKVVFTSATNLWLDAVGDARIIAVTGTKGKSTTATLLATLLEKAGYAVALGGNIGTPLLDLIERGSCYDFWVIELSSYQTCELEKWPEIAVLVNLFPEHIPWHGSIEQYYQDKLRLFKNNQCLSIINFKDPISACYTESWSNLIYFNRFDGFHVEENMIFDNDCPLLELPELKLVGRHNLSNICAILTVLRQLNVNIAEVLPTLMEFRGLPHRLQVLGKKSGITYVNDSISTIPESAIAAIEAFPNQPITILLGGQDRHQNFDALTAKLHKPYVNNVITMYETGSRIADALKIQNIAHDKRPTSRHAKDLESAMQIAKKLTSENGTILLSPASPSFDAFRDYQKRGNTFQQLAGF